MYQVHALQISPYDIENSQLLNIYSIKFVKWE